MTGYINSGLPIRAIKYIAAGDHIHCATAIFHHKLVTTQVADSRTFLLPLPLGEGSPMAIPGPELLSGFSNLERSAYRIKLDPLPGVPPVIESISGEASGKTSGKTSGKILEAIRQKPQVTIPELSAQIGVTSCSIERNLHKLQDEKRLLRIGPAKGGHWQVVESSRISLPLEP